MLGLGLGLNKNTAFKKYALDYIPGAYESCVAFFSYYQPSAKYKDELCRIKRLDTGTEKDIGPVNGYIEDSAVSSFCTGTTGLVTTIYNSSSAAGKQNAIQTTPANMPIIYEGGAFLSDGFKFVAANSKGMNITTYTDLNILNPPLSLYANYYKSNISNGFIFSKFQEFELFSYASGGVTYATFRLADYQRNGDIQEANPGANKFIATWKDRNANGLLSRVNTNTAVNTFAGNITNINNVYIGYRASSNYHTGNIKTIAIFNNNQYNNYTQLAALI